MYTAAAPVPNTLSEQMHRFSCAVFLVTNMYTFSMHVANPVILHNSTNMIRTKKQTYRFVQKERDAPEHEKQQFSLTNSWFWSMKWYQMGYSDSADTKIRWDLYPTGSCASTQQILRQRLSSVNGNQKWGQWILKPLDLGAPYFQITYYIYNI